MFKRSRQEDLDRSPRPDSWTYPAEPLTEAQQAELESIQWFHSIKLRDGISTRGHLDRSLEWRTARQPEFRDKSVLDIGVWDGFSCFEAAKAGAGSVFATDSFACTSGGRQHDGQGFRFARSVLGLDNIVDYDCRLSLMEIPVRRYDVVICWGVLYYIEQIDEAVDRLCELSGEWLTLETLTTRWSEPDIVRQPVMPGTDEVTWAIGAGYLADRLERSGFEVVDTYKYSLAVSNPRLTMLARRTRL